MGLHFSRRYLREEVLPTPFCPGCFNGIVMNALFKAMEELGISNLRKYVFVSGIGCSSWIPSPHFKADTIHTLHGRATAVATGVKLARPDLNVIVIGGDGDLAAIGFNHLAHAARRNMDILVILINNLVYGMTRGQASPTTPEGLRTATTPFGAFEPVMDVAGMLATSNANYVARWCVANFGKLKNSFKDVLSRYSRGFRFVEVIAPCITYVVRYEGKTPSQKLKELMKICRKGETPFGRIGVLKAEDKPGYLDRYREYVRRAGGEVRW